MARMAPPEVVVTDGGSGFQKARRQLWPTTRVQRCTFHAFEQVRRYTTTRPRTQAGVDLYALAKRLLRVEDSEHAAAWVAAFATWCSDYDEFLKEETTNDEGRSFLAHERLVKARNSLAALVRQQTLFTYVDPGLVGRLGPFPPPTMPRRASTASSDIFSGSTGGSRLRGVSRPSVGGATCTRSAPCRQQRSSR